MFINLSFSAPSRPRSILLASLPVPFSTSTHLPATAHLILPFPVHQSSYLSPFSIWRAQHLMPLSMWNSTQPMKDPSNLQPPVLETILSWMRIRMFRTLVPKAERVLSSMTRSKVSLTEPLHGEKGPAQGTSNWRLLMVNRSCISKPELSWFMLLWFDAYAVVIFSFWREEGERVVYDRCFFLMVNSNMFIPLSRPVNP